jgi:hypothetical protein
MSKSFGISIPEPRKIERKQYFIEESRKWSGRISGYGGVSAVPATYKCRTSDTLLA